MSMNRIRISIFRRKYSNIRIYSNKFAKNVKVSECKIFTYPENTFQSERVFHILTLINKNYRSSPCSQNIVQILSLFLKNLSIFPSNNFWIFGPKYSNIRIIFGFWKSPRIEYEYQYSEENIRIFEYIRIFVSTLVVLFSLLIIDKVSLKEIVVKAKVPVFLSARCSLM